MQCGRTGINHGIKQRRYETILDFVRYSLGLLTGSVTNDVASLRREIVHMKPICVVGPSRSYGKREI